VSATLAVAFVGLVALTLAACGAGARTITVTHGPVTLV
jgi:hypothetical protein